MPKTAEDFFNDGKSKIPIAPPKKETDKEPGEKENEKKEPQTPMLQHPLPVPDKQEAEEPRKSQKEEKHPKKSKKEHRPHPETSKPYGHSEYSSSGESYEAAFKYNLPVDDYSD